MSRCPNKELFERYVTGKCSEDEQRSVDEHLAQCEKCQEHIKLVRPNKASSKRSGPANDYQKSNSADVKEIPAEGDQVGAGSMPEMTTASSNTRVPDEILDVKIEGYDILEQLPRGGQAVVYKAIHKATKTKVALKVLPHDIADSRRARFYFEQEADLIASLSHPYIVTIRNRGIAKGQCYFSMEYIHGQSLDRYVKSQSLSFRKNMELFSKICDALTHAHQRGVIHRDLKPSNILIDDRGEPRILDFGLAKTAVSMGALSESTDMLSKTGQIMGTVAYMSPEQAAGRPDLIDVRTDVYSLGVILYQMLTGQFPYDVSGSAYEALHNVQHVVPMRPRQMISRFDSDVEAILLKALAKDPDQRYQAAAELGHDIKCWLNGFPIVAKSVSSLYLLRKVITRHLYTSTVITLLIVIIFGFSCVYYQLYTKLRESYTELQETQQSLNKEIQEKVALAEQVVFMTHFLRAWHTERWSQAQLIANHFGRGTREEEGALFLLDPRPLAEKLAGFRQKLKTSEPCFTEFIIAEHHLRSNNRSEAVKCYQECLSYGAHLAKDEWLEVKVKSRLYELGEEDWRDKIIPRDRKE